ncbi:MAG: methyltransferase [Gammaproteobacteria bacterium]|nr:methyltransferase [Gammaproteobacteria bacterium]
MSDVPEPVKPGKVIRAISHLWLVPKREYLRRFRIGRTVHENVAGLMLVVLPEVFNPVVFRTGKYFAEQLHEMTLPNAGITQGGRAIDLGCGSGILAVTAAKLGYHVDAVDLNDEAVKCTGLNASRSDVADRIAVMHGDLFEPVANSRYDLVLFSPPSFRGEPTSKFDLCWRAADIFERFSAELPNRLNAGGQALVLQTSDGDEKGLLQAMSSSGLRIDIAARKHFGVEILTIYRLTQTV